MTKTFAWRLFALGLFVAATMPFVSSESSSSVDAGTIAGDYVWLAGGQTAALQQTCDTEAFGTDCVELCMTAAPPTVISMNKYCCLDPTMVGGWDNPQECTHWVTP